MHPSTQIQLIADTLLPGFIPKDPEAVQLEFHFTIPPNHHYKVRYEKQAGKGWVFVYSEKAEA